MNLLLSFGRGARAPRLTIKDGNPAPFRTYERLKSSDSLGLAELGFDVNYLKRLTALHQAAFDGNLELVKLLVALGADPTILDRSYNATPLGWAEHNNQQAIIDYLAPLQPSQQSEPSHT